VPNRNRVVLTLVDYSGMGGKAGKPKPDTTVVDTGRNNIVVRVGQQSFTISAHRGGLYVTVDHGRVVCEPEVSNSVVLRRRPL
jgi:hypothetical protein